MKKICVMNQKGGSGKTTTAVLIALALAGEGRRVLAVDGDPQGGLTAYLLPDGERRGLFDLLMGEAVTPLAIDRGGLTFDLLPADYRLDKIYATMGPYELEKPLGRFQYDYIVLDTPPTVQGITRAAAFISDTLIIPADISPATIRPTLYTLKSLEEIKKTGRVYLIGKEPDGKHGFTADTARDFITALGKAYGGTIPRSVTMQKIAADRERAWTPARIEKQLKPILQAVTI